jgi:putative tryptophan/tyrosine transport system substrate-binding protein
MTTSAGPHRLQWIFRGRMLMRLTVTPLATAVALLLLAVPLAVEAQRKEEKLPRIGVLGGNRSAQTARIKAFRDGLGELGYVEGKSIVIEWRFVGDKGDRLPALAIELTRLKVDVLVAFGPRRPKLPRKRQTRFPSSWHKLTIPSVPDS